MSVDKPSQPPACRLAASTIGANSPLTGNAANEARRPEDDPRFQRIRAKLTSALLELAAQKPADQISVSELTAAAKVSRTTFYKHAESPAAFLAEYLIGELNSDMAPLANLLDDTGPGYLMRWRQVHLDLLNHVRQNEGVYKHVFTADGQSVVLAMLSVCFQDIFSSYVHAFREHIDGPQPSDLWTEMAISQQVHNTIVVISSWLRTGMEDSPEEVVAAYISLVPPWQLARFDDSGRTTLRRARGPEALLERLTDQVLGNELATEGDLGLIPVPQAADGSQPRTYGGGRIAIATSKRPSSDS